MSEFYSIANYIDKYLFELHAVTNIVVVDRTVDMTVILQTLIGTLAAEHRIYLLKQIREGKLLVFQYQSA